MKFGLICVSTLCRCADAKIAQRLKSTFFWGKISQSMGPWYKKNPTLLRRNILCIFPASRGKWKSMEISHYKNIFLKHEFVLNGKILLDYHTSKNWKLFAVKTFIFYHKLKKMADIFWSKNHLKFFEFTAVGPDVNRHYPQNSVRKKIPNCNYNFKRYLSPSPLLTLLLWSRK